MSEEMRKILDEAKSITGLVTYTDVVRLAVTTLVRRSRLEERA